MFMINPQIIQHTEKQENFNTTQEKLQSIDILKWHR